MLLPSIERGGRSKIKYELWLSRAKKRYFKDLPQVAPISAYKRRYKRVPAPVVTYKIHSEIDYLYVTDYEGLMLGKYDPQ